jgi:hypothetical protein
VTSRPRRDFVLNSGGGPLDINLLVDLTRRSNIAVDVAS